MNPNTRRKATGSTTSNTCRSSPRAAPRGGTRPTSTRATKRTKSKKAASSSKAPSNQLFSADLSLAALTTFGHTRLEYPPLSPLTTERTPYERTISRPCKASPAPTGCFTPLVTASSVSAGVQFGGTVRFEAADESLRHVVLDSGVRLTEEGPAGMAFYMYEWSAASGHLQLVASASNSQGGGDNGVGYGHHGAPRRLQHAVAANGRVVYHVQGHLYLYDPSAGEWFSWMPAARAGRCSEPPTPTARASSSPTNAATPDSHASAGHPELFVCEAPVAPKPSCTLHDLTSGAGPGDVLGVLGASDGGDVVYYAANAALAAGAKPGACREGVSAVREEPAEPNGHKEAHQLAGTCNLYVQRYDGAADGWQPPALVGRLSAEDQPDWPALTSLTARVSRDGDRLVFMSDRSLGGASSYDTHNLLSGRADEEVYAYNGAAGSLFVRLLQPVGRATGGAAGRDAEPRREGPGRRPRRGVARTLAGRNIPTGTSGTATKPATTSRATSPKAGACSSTAPKCARAAGHQRQGGRLRVGAGRRRQLHGRQRKLRGALGGLPGPAVLGTSSHEAAFMDVSADGDDAYFVTAASALAERLRHDLRHV